MFPSRMLHALWPALLCLLAAASGCVTLAEGERVLPDGSVYQGELADDRLHGEGRLESLRGMVYEGEFRQGLIHGKGRMELPDGRVFIGRFERGEPAGVMRYRDAEGYEYEGGILDWQFHGDGVLVDVEGNRYEGYFHRGVPEGEGRYEGADGEVYEGNFQQGQYHGMGRQVRPDGAVYEGMFRQGRYHGEGTLSRADPEPWEQEELSGAWENGEYVEGRAERHALAKRNAEQVLYNQRQLLDEALSGLKPSDDDAPSLYLLALAGDGSEEVFRREVEFVRDQFAELFGVTDRSLLLVNSRNAVEHYPMATRTSLRHALDGLAERMNPEKDILFVYLTSHGTRDHELYLTQDGMLLPDLPAAELAEMLAQHPVRWKVVTVSACFSGGFIEPLANDDTMVITAARADRPSFGCYDQAPLTWFGRAFLDQALPEADSFPQALELARERVAAREEEEGIEHPSEPQSHAPEAIAQYLKEWWRMNRE